MAWTDLARKYLQAHHLSYARLGHERLDDLEALCMHCHENEHELRAEPGQGTDPDFIPSWVENGKSISLIMWGDWLPYCRAECSGCDRRLHRWEIEIPMTAARLAWLIFNREPGAVAGDCTFCGWTACNCFCGDCKLQWTLDGGVIRW